MDETQVIGWQELPKNAELHSGTLITNFKKYSDHFVRFEQLDENGNLFIALVLPETTLYKKVDDHYEIANK